MSKTVGNHVLKTKTKTIYPNVPCAKGQTILPPTGMTAQPCRRSGGRNWPLQTSMLPSEEIASGKKLPTERHRHRDLFQGWPG